LGVAGAGEGDGGGGGGADGEGGGAVGKGEGDGEGFADAEGDGDTDGEGEAEAVGDTELGVALQPPARKMYCASFPLQPFVMPAGCEYQLCMFAGSALTKRFITLLPTISP
jgi:hypothetical protein